MKYNTSKIIPITKKIKSFQIIILLIEKKSPQIIKENICEIKGIIEETKSIPQINLQKIMKNKDIINNLINHVSQFKNQSESRTTPILNGSDFNARPGTIIAKRSKKKYRIIHHVK